LKISGFFTRKLIKIVLYFIVFIVNLSDFIKNLQKPIKIITNVLLLARKPYFSIEKQEVFITEKLINNLRKSGYFSENQRFSRK